jgi:hypothetical protein
MTALGIKRRKLTTLDKLKVVIDQARCPLCKEKLGDLANLQFDHIHALALGGEDSVENIRAVHAECHAVKTTGRRGESDLSLRDGDQGKIAKLKRRDKKRAAEQAPAESPREHLKGKRSMRRQPAEKLSPCRTPEKLRALKELRR